MHVSVKAIYMACKSHVSVNHLHLHVQTFYTYIVDVYIIFLHLHFTQGQCKYLSNTLTQPCVNVLGVCKCIY
jgi:hypothetical protein